MHSDTTLGPMTSSFWNDTVDDTHHAFSTKNHYLEVPCDETTEPDSPLTPISPASELESDCGSDPSTAEDEFDQDELDGHWLMPTSIETAADYQDEYVYQVLSVGDDDDFPLIHEFTTAWNFTPPPHTQLPSIRFTPSASPSNHLHSIVPLQDFKFGRQLTVLDHHAVNVVHPPMALDAFASGNDDFLSPSPFRSSSQSSPDELTSVSSSPDARVNPYVGTGVTVQDALAYLWQVIPEDWSCGCWAWEKGRWTAVVDQITDKQPAESDDAPVEYIPSHNKGLRRHWDRKRRALATQMNGRIVSGELPRPCDGVEVLETINEEDAWNISQLGEDFLADLDEMLDLDEEDYPLILHESSPLCEALLDPTPSPPIQSPPLPTHTTSGKPIEIYDPDAEEELPDLTGW